jgi:methyl-accepting chemotaxis protein
MFRNLTIKARLVAVLAFLSVLMAAMGIAGLFGMNKTNGALKSVYEDRTVALRYLGQVERTLSSNRLQMANALLTRTPEAGKTAAERIAANVAASKKAWESYVATTLTPEEKKIADVVSTQQEKIVKESLEPAMALLKNGDFDALQTAYTSASARKVNTEARESIEKLVQLQLDVAKDEYEAATSRFKTTTTAMMTALALAVLLTIVVGVALVRAIVKPLSRAVVLADAVAAGDLTQTVDSHRNDEVGRLLDALKRMTDGLNGLVHQVRVGVNTIATGSQQISAGNQDLSQRTEEQASSLEETASSMEELTSTVKQSADNARQANQLAAGASAIAVKGGEVVTQVVSTMSGISDSSKKIADIIGVIDGIAFQTNILALNAAVEAARAGEQGRGFAVVASEVRTRAQRSAAAAKEIKELITDSVHRVDDGTKLVSEAGKTMEEVVGAVKRVTDIMAEITAAAQEQSSGIEQVNQAVMQMDQVTQQNAALVEEAAAAADSMQQQAQALSKAVAVFKVSHSAKSMGATAEETFEPVHVQPVVERRGPARAKNVSRLSQKREPKVEAAPESRKTGTDGDWSEF